MNGKHAPGETAGTPERHPDAAREDRRDFAHWMQRALDEREKVLVEFAEDAVHDLRVAIRRCRSIAWGMRLVDPHPGWCQLNRDARTLFRKLGELRDTQVLILLARALGPPGDPVGVALLEMLNRREADQISAARAPLAAFPVEEWAALGQALLPRVQRLPPGSPFFEYLAVRLLREATAIQRQAVRSRNPALWHELRIAIKRFRYVVENFLPGRAVLWIKHLKQLQDLLGDVHDLDVLWATLGDLGSVFDIEASSRWRGLVDRQRSLRIATFSRKTTGPRSLWRTWRGELPSRSQLDQASRTRITAWLGFADPESSRAERSATIALELFDHLVSSGTATEHLSGRARDLLECAALCRTVGVSRRHGTRKARAREILSKLPKLVDWPSSDVSMIALLVRHHRGRMLSLDDPPVAALTPATRETFLVLLGVLRLAVVLDSIRRGESVAV